jgi:hypothetical protein
MTDEVPPPPAPDVEHVAPQEVVTRLVTAIEDACLAEVQAALDRHGCQLIAVPEPVGDLWTMRVAVRYRRD